MHTIFSGSDKEPTYCVDITSLICYHAYYLNCSLKLAEYPQTMQDTLQLQVKFVIMRAPTSQTTLKNLMNFLQTLASSHQGTNFYYVNEKSWNYCEKTKHTCK